MTVSQKVLCSFLLSALLCAGIAALAFTGIFTHYGDIAGESAQILIPVAVFLTLFLIIFLCFNLRRDSAKEPKELETVEERPEHNADTMSAANIASADFISAADFMSAEAVQVESVIGLDGSFFMFRQPFTFTPGNPELLQEAGDEVIYEQNGIHYINSNVFADDERRDKFDSNFAKLVESVVNKKELML